MASIVTLTLVIGFSMLVTKIATIALVHTGMSKDRAKFQARSAFSGAGFTTSESELVVYGRAANIKTISERPDQPSADRDHANKVAQHQEELRQQDKKVSAAKSDQS